MEVNNNLEVISSLIDEEKYEEAFSKCNSLISDNNDLYDKITWCLIKQKIIQLLFDKNPYLSDELIPTIKSHINDDVNFVKELTLRSNISGDVMGLSKEYMKLHTANTESLEIIIGKPSKQL